jgi:hypothetical protein
MLGLTRLLFIGLPGAILLILPTGVAQAATSAVVHPMVTCSGYGCDDQDPIATGCSAGSYTVTSAPVTLGGTSYGTVELRWSPTCQTNWSRVTVTAGGSNPSGWWRDADVERQSPYAYDGFSYNGAGSPIYGDMLYAPGCAEAYGAIQIDANDWAFGQARQPGC